jgi:hypothetical protein
METSRFLVRQRIERQRLAEHPEEVGSVFLRELLRGEIEF